MNESWNRPTEVHELRRRVREQLSVSDHAIDPREANLLIGLALGWNEVEVLTRGLETLDKLSVGRVGRLVAERCSGRPFAYLAQQREFYGRPFYVDERVLIPRPETEHLVEAVLSLSPTSRNLLDLGTGSGCIAITLALELPDSRVLASDLSIAALAVARRNAIAHGVRPTLDKDASQQARFNLVASDLAMSIDLSSFDTVVSNPPYVAANATIAATVRDFEPGLALFANEDGLAIYRRLVGPESPLKHGQRLVLELGADQLEPVVEMAGSRFKLLSITKDLAGWQRVLTIERF